MNIIGPSTHVLDLGVSMSSNCTFDFHISNLCKQCSNLAGCILRTFTMRDPQVMLTLYKSLVMSKLNYASHLWSPYLLKHVYLIETVQRAFTKHISGMCYLYTVNVERDMALFMCGRVGLARGEGVSSPPHAPCLIKFIMIDIDLYIR